MSAGWRHEVWLEKDEGCRRQQRSGSQVFQHFTTPVATYTFPDGTALDMTHQLPVACSARL